MTEGGDDARLLLETLEAVRVVGAPAGQDLDRDRPAETGVVLMGVLFTLHDMGRIDLGEPRNEFAAGRAVDGDVTTRWSSAFRDSQWLMVDLGSAVALSRIRLNWEAAYAKDYELQISSDGTNWTTVRRVKDGEGGVEEQEVGQTARYVRVLGLRRATPYGISLWELQVFDADGALVSQGRLTM